MMFRIFLLLLILATTPSLHANSNELEQIASNFKPTASEIEAGAVILKYDVGYEIKRDGKYVRKDHIIVAILDDRAVSDYAEISESFNSFYSDTKLVLARLIDSNKKIHNIQPNAVQIKSDNTNRVFNDIKYVSFAFKGLEKNSIFEYQLETVSKKNVLQGQWYSDLYFVMGQVSNAGYRVDPIRKSVVNIKLPEEMDLIYETKNIKLKHKKEKKKGFAVYRWEASDIPKIKTESYLASYDDIYPLLRVSTIPSWSIIDDWGKEKYLRAFLVDSQIKELSNSIAEGKNTKLEIVKAIYNYVTKNIRYISADYRRSGVIPHSPKEVLDNKYGDCKDQSMLLVKLLEAKGIKAYPTLVSFIPELDASKEIPSMNFSHMIVYVPNVNNGVWIDASGDIATFPGISWLLEDQYAFVINGNGGEVRKISRNTYLSNKIDVDVTYDLLSESNKINADLKINVGGHLGESYKYTAKFSEDPEEKIRQIIDYLYQQVEINKIRINENVGFNLPFQVDVSLTFKEIWASEERKRFIYAGGVKKYLDIFTGFSNLPRPQERKTNFHLGHELKLNIVETYNSPGIEFKPSLIAQNAELKSDYFDYEHKLTNYNDRVVSKASFNLKDRYIDKEKYGDFYKKYTEVTNTGAWQVTYSVDNLHKEKMLITKEIDDSGETTKNLLKLAVNHIDSANYNGSKTLLLNIIKKEPDNGEAYYYLGVTEGFLGNSDASNDAFEKASQNGYVP